jgi:nucleoside 2-deoxyribosyltransferase
MTLRAYLAGPDVFLPNAVDVGAAKSRVCSEHGIEGVFPLDGDLDFAALMKLAPADQAFEVFRACIVHMDSCDIAVANLTPFRGVSMDVGTAVEIGYMHGQGKPVFGYTGTTVSFGDRVEADGLMVEPFALVDNLMVEGPVRSSGAHVLRSDAPPEHALEAMDAFEACILHVVEVMATP